MVSTLESLTPPQRRIFDFIAATIGEKGYPPTMREILGHFGYRSINGVNDHLKSLERKGYIDRGAHRQNRAITLKVTPQPRPIARRAALPLGPRIPVFSKLAAPVEVLCSTRRPSMAGGATFAYVMPDESLKGRGIAAGDWLFVETGATVEPGQVGLVRSGAEEPVVTICEEGVVGPFVGRVMGLYRPIGAAE